NFPAVLSILVDGRATVRALRIVSDPRDRSASRERAFQLGNFLLGRFGGEGAWSCTDLAAQDGESAVFGTFGKRHCEQATARTHLSLDIRHLRKPGQAAIDPITGQLTQGQFESEARFEMR